jgi:ribosomal protein L35
VSREASNWAFFIAMKTNKSFTKRLRVTKHGKIIARVPGQNHFNAKESGTGRQRRRRGSSIQMTSALRSRFLPSSN